jgi:hypothetical protein
MSSTRAASLVLLMLLTGCSRPLFETSETRQTDFDRKATCNAAAQQLLSGRGDGDIYTSKDTYIQESFYSPTRNSCVAVLILTTGSLAPLDSGNLQDTYSDEYEIVDSLTHQKIQYKVSGRGADRDKAAAEIENEIEKLK